MYYYNDDVNKFVEDTIKTVNQSNIEDYIEFEIIGKKNDDQLCGDKKEPAPFVTKGQNGTGIECT